MLGNYPGTGMPIGGGTVGASVILASGLSPLPLNTWSHVATTYDGAAVRLYINGAEVSTVSATGLLTTSPAPLEIGGSLAEGGLFAGLIDDVRVYATALAPAQIQTDMQTPVADPPPVVPYVVVSPSPSAVPFHGSQTLTAQAYTASNQPMSGLTYTWTTSNAAVAAITSTGPQTVTLSGQSIGTSTITATVSGYAISASAAVTVVPGAYLVYESFTGDVTNLAWHAPEISQPGRGWNVPSAGPQIASGRAATWLGGGALATIDAQSADVTAGVDWMPGDDSWVMGTLLFRQTDTTHYLSADWITNRSTGSSYVQIAQTSPDTGPVAWAVAPVPLPAPGSVHRLEVRTHGDDVQLWVDQQLTLETHVAFNVAATIYGLAWASCCDGSSTYDNFTVQGTPPPYVAQVILSPPTTTTPFGIPQTFTAQALDAGGQLLPNVTFSWSSSNPVVIAVTPVSGSTAQVTGLSQGGATITATPTLGASGSIALTVDPGTYLISDRFTGDAANLAWHTPEISQPGTSWSVPIAGPMSATGRAATLLGEGGIATIDAKSADVTAGVDWFASDLSWTMGTLLFRLTDTAHYLSADWVTDRGTGSSYVQLAQTSPETGAIVLAVAGMIVPAPGSVHRLEVRTIGDDVQLWVDQQLTLDTHVAFNAAATRYGLAWMACCDASSTYDNFTVQGTLSPPVSQVIVSPSTTTTPFGTPQTFTAQARDAAGQLLSNVSVNWSSSNAAVMTVVPVSATSAQVTGLTQGAATITATAAGGAAGAITLTVDPGQALVRDTFSTARGGQLTAHTPEIDQVGHGWTATTTASIPVQSGLAGPIGVSVSEAIASIDAGSPDVTASVDWSPGSSDLANGGLIFRMSDATHYWLAAYWDRVFYLQRVSGTSVSTINAVSLDHAASPKHIEVRLAGSAMEVWLDGVRRFQWSDGYNAWATRYGLHWYPDADPGSSFSNFSVTGPLAPLVTAVTVTPATLTLLVDQAATVMAAALDGSGSSVSGAYVRWASSNDAILSIVPQTTLMATVVAHDVGTTTIFALAPRGPAGGGAVPVMVTSCVDPLALTSTTSAAAGGTSTIEVSAPQACIWSARSEVSWIGVAAGAGPGVRTIDYVVTANTTGAARTGTVFLGGRRLTVHQDAVPAEPCSVSLWPPSGSFGGAAGSGGFEVTSNCSWSAAVGQPNEWVHVSGSGNGNGSVTYTVDATTNTEQGRWAVIHVGQADYMITQGPVDPRQVVAVSARVSMGCSQAVPRGRGTADKGPSPCPRRLGVRGRQAATPPGLRWEAPLAPVVGCWATPSRRTPRRVRGTRRS